MTGFGRGSAANDSWRCRAEISSVNRKQLDVLVSLPNELAEMERHVRIFLAERLSRGRVVVKLSVESAGDAPLGRLRFDHGLAKQYVEHYRALAQEFQGQAIAPLDLVRAPGVFVTEAGDVDAENVWGVARAALEDALAKLEAMRNAEGGNLRETLETGLTRLEQTRDAIAERAPLVVEYYRRSLRRRLEEAGVPLPLEDERLTREIGLFAEKCDIQEELDRLRSHFRQMRAYLNSAEPVGRSLDFLAQELFREFNTIGSKANDAGLAQLVVEGKTELEKIREQAQNVE